ncbi:MAG: FkbM family methyltransferase [Kiritimatiellae bacterium]|nr:FkbM family methyltransferase [Kiritimatiellia bacterium]MDD5522697.1 FkbM family methyltransferase [Kiritimatiellia bacterium]
MIKIINSIIKRCGYKLARLEQKTFSKGMADVLAHASGMGFSPVTVIDVGAASGTRALYESYPDAFHLMIEPVKEFEETLRSLLRKYKGDLVSVAASSVEGEIDMQVHPEYLFGSSFLQEQVTVGFDRVTRRVKTVTIDKILGEKQLNGPYLIKVDVQGAEIEVLNGARQALTNAEMVLLEVSFFEFLKGCPQFFDVVLYMKNQGFVVYDLFGAALRPIDGALAQCDVAFVKEHGMFRKDIGYATADQWKQFLVRRGSR